MILDTHVHLVGNGSRGTGCWYRPGPFSWVKEPFMAHGVGLPGTALRGDLDGRYFEQLLSFVQSSSLDAVVLLAQDEVYDDDGRKMAGRGTFYVPNSYVLRLSREHPEFLPAVSIHPARSDALDELDRSVAEGAVALKLLPNCHNVDCSLPRYRRFWEKMAEARLPLIAHTGGEASVEEIRPELADPRNLRAPLEAGVTVIAAHCGSRSSLGGSDYFSVFRQMLRAYPNLYGDLSALSLPGRLQVLEACRHSQIVNRVVNGSDVPVPVTVFPAFGRKAIGWREYLRLRKITNPLERDYQLKRSLGYPEAVFTRAESLLRLDHRKAA